jgi:hypothetical protein
MTKRTVCCVHGLVERPCTTLCECSEEDAETFRELLRDREIRDSGRRRDGKIVWVLPTFRQ